MRLNLLSESPHPDFSDLVVHFVDRWGERVDEVPEWIQRMDPRERLVNILTQGRILAFTTWGLRNKDQVVCFSECTRAGVQELIRAGRYEPVGCAFRKDFVLGRGGGPAFYVRGDEWPGVQEMPEALRFRATRFWPGAEPDDSEQLPQCISSRSEWTREREWRVRGLGDPPGFEFSMDDVAFLIIPERTDYVHIVQRVEEVTSGRFERPYVLVARHTAEITDPYGAWPAHSPPAQLTWHSAVGD